MFNIFKIIQTAYIVKKSPFIVIPLKFNFPDDLYKYISPYQYKFYKFINLQMYF